MVVDLLMEVVVAPIWPLVDRAALAAAHGAVVIGPAGTQPPAIDPPESGVLAAATPVTEAMKHVEGDRVTGSIDRGRLVELDAPLVLSAGAVAAVLRATGDGTVDVVSVIADLGLEVRALPGR